MIRRICLIVVVSMLCAGAAHAGSSEDASLPWWKRKKGGDACAKCKGSGKLQEPCKACRGPNRRDAFRCPDCTTKTKGPGGKEVKTATGWKMCPSCRAKAPAAKSCKRCKGSGRIKCHHCQGGWRARCTTCRGRNHVAVKCQPCKGTGWKDRRTSCGDCAGTGKMIFCRRCAKRTRWIYSGRKIKLGCCKHGLWRTPFPEKDAVPCVTCVGKGYLIEVSGVRVRAGDPREVVLVKVRAKLFAAKAALEKHETRMKDLKRDIPYIEKAISAAKQEVVTITKELKKLEGGKPDPKKDKNPPAAKRGGVEINKK
jgi:hypothetical protein